ncbi:MAG: MFS transporter [Patescibacteria group bacterium]|nr:MFS transporter [Patescibacteria group bacterium]MDE1966315.1 MFS transporter [Patescibacteria group bacterium]
MSRRSLPSGVRSLALARTVRYIGWGFSESLIPVFIMSLAGSYAAAGLVRATYDVTLLLALPLLGLLAERYPAKWLVVAGLLLYPFVGFSYFLAGATGLLAFIVIARAINGVSWGLDATGIDTYFRRLTPVGSIASAFGFLDMLSELGWIAAALAGIWLVRFFTVPELLLLVIPFSLLALPFALRARRDHPSMGNAKRAMTLRSAYRHALAEWESWHGELRLLAFLLLFSEAITVLIDFFVPIDIYEKSASLALVIVFTVVSALPFIFGYLLGKFADRHDKPRLVALACGAMALILLALSLPLPYLLVVLAGLLLGTLLELITILERSIATELVPATHFGRLDSVFSIVTGISDLAAPPLLGALLMLIGLPALAAILAAIALAFAFVFLSRGRRRGRPRGISLTDLIPPPEHKV